VSASVNVCVCMFACLHLCVCACVSVCGFVCGVKDCIRNILMSRVTHMNESFHTYASVMSHMNE